MKEGKKKDDRRERESSPERGNELIERKREGGGITLRRT